MQEKKTNLANRQLFIKVVRRSFVLSILAMKVVRSCLCCGQVGKRSDGCSCVGGKSHRCLKELRAQPVTQESQVQASTEDLACGYCSVEVRFPFKAQVQDVDVPPPSPSHVQMVLGGVPCQAYSKIPESKSKVNAAFTDRDLTDLLELKEVVNSKEFKEFQNLRNSVIASMSTSSSSSASLSRGEASSKISKAWHRMSLKLINANELQDEWIEVALKKTTI